MTMPTGTAAVVHREYLNVIHADEGKRYKLNVRGDVGRLTVGKVKQCIAAASSCPIPLSEMVLYLNGVQLTSDSEVCARLGIENGTSLTVEPREAVEAATAAAAVEAKRRSLSAAAPEMRMPACPPSDLPMQQQQQTRTREDLRPGTVGMSEPRKLLEVQTLAQQRQTLSTTCAVQNAVLQSAIDKMDAAAAAAAAQRQHFERQQRATAAALQRLRQDDEAAEVERRRLAELQQVEVARTQQRTAALASRREQLRAEEAAVRAVSQLRLENEKKKAMVAQQRALYAAEQQRAAEELRRFEADAKARELELRAREVDLEHQRLGRIREARELERDQQLALQQRLEYYDRIGIAPPADLQKRAAAIGATSSSKNVAVVEERRSPSFPAARVEAPGQRSPIRWTQPPPPPSTAVAGGGGRGGRGPASLSRRTPSIDSVPPATYEMQDGYFYDAYENAVENVRRLGEDLGLVEPLQLDDRHTCVVSVDGEYTLLLTYDAATERLYLFSTLLAALPPVVQTAAGRLRLYEYLLSRSLLGRETCGGSIGASLQRQFILLSSSLYMPTSQPWSLRVLAPQFLHCMQYWRRQLREFLAALEEEDNGEWKDGAAEKTEAAQADDGNDSAAAVAAAAAVHRSPNPSKEAMQDHQTSPSPSRIQHHDGEVMENPSMQQQQRYYRPSTAAPSPLLPVLGLEVTGTVLVNGIPTRYDNGVLVVSAAGPAASAGIQPNDFIDSLNGVAIRSVADFKQVVMEQLIPGTSAPLRLHRGGVAMVVDLQVEGSRPL